MTREQHLQFCKLCTKRKFNPQVGIVCSLTGEIANFEEECKDYEEDQSAVETAAFREPVDHVDGKLHMSENEIEKYKAEQNYTQGTIGAIAVGLLGAILWGAITVATNFQIGYMAVAIGAGVGITLRQLGKGIEPKFGLTGAVVAVLSCLLGNFLSIIGYIANYEDLGYIETLTLFDYSLTLDIMTEAFSFIDILFYGIAAYEGYKFSFRKFEHS